MQYNIIMYATMYTERDNFYGYEIVVCRLLLACEVVRVGRLPEEVLLKESSVRRGEG
jgi:hypothetical protein